MAPQCGEKHAGADELAREFCRCLQAQPDCVGLAVQGEWIEDLYPLFCESLGITEPPPYKDFAHKLKEVMPRRRIDRLRNGKRKTFTVYGIPPLQAAADAVELPTRRRA